MNFPAHQRKLLLPDAKETFIIQHDRRRFTTFPSTPRDRTLHATPSLPLLPPSSLPPFFIFITSHPFWRAHDELRRLHLSRWKHRRLLNSVITAIPSPIFNQRIQRVTRKLADVGQCESSVTGSSVSQDLRWTNPSEWVIVKNRDKESMDETILVGRSLEERSLSRNFRFDSSNIIFLDAIVDFCRLKFFRISSV